MPPTDPPRPAGVCLGYRTIKARLVIRDSHPGGPIHYPLLVVDKCPWTPPFTAGHGHAHTLCWPGQRQVKVAPCNRVPYVLDIAA